MTTLLIVFDTDETYFNDVIKRNFESSFKLSPGQYAVNTSRNANSVKNLLLNDWQVFLEQNPKQTWHLIVEEINNFDADSITKDFVLS